MTGNENYKMDYKISIWATIYIESEHFEAARTIIENNTLSLTEKVNALYGNNYVLDSEMHNDTEEMLIPEENKGNSTMELFGDDDKIVWENGRSNYVPTVGFSKPLNLFKKYKGSV